MYGLSQDDLALQNTARASHVRILKAFEKQRKATNQ